MIPSKSLATGAVVAALAFAAALARRPSPEPAPPKRSAPAPVAVEAAPPPAPPRPVPSWAEVTALLDVRLGADPAVHRADVASLTAAHLGLDGEAGTTFQETSLSAAEEIADARQARDAAALGDPTREPEFQAAYEEAKGMSVARVQELLDSGNARHRDFRRRIEEYVDALR